MKRTEPLYTTLNYDQNKRFSKVSKDARVRIK